MKIIVDKWQNVPKVEVCDGESMSRDHLSRNGSPKLAEPVTNNKVAENNKRVATLKWPAGRISYLLPREHGMGVGVGDFSECEKSEEENTYVYV